MLIKYAPVPLKGLPKCLEGMGRITQSTVNAPLHSLGTALDAPCFLN